MTLAVLLLTIVAATFFLNLFRYFKTKRLYQVFLSRKNVTIHIPEIDSVFKNAGTSYLTTYDERKHGYLERSRREVAYLADRETYYYEVDKVFQLTIGVYRSRIKNSINPFYWLFLPLNILYSYNIVPGSFLKIVINVAYWILTTIAAYILNEYLNIAHLDHLQQLLHTLL